MPGYSKVAAAPLNTPYKRQFADSVHICPQEAIVRQSPQMWTQSTFVRTKTVRGHGRVSEDNAILVGCSENLVFGTVYTSSAACRVTGGIPGAPLSRGSELRGRPAGTRASSDRWANARLVALAL